MRKAAAIVAFLSACPLAALAQSPAAPLQPCCAVPADRLTPPFKSVWPEPQLLTETVDILVSYYLQTSPPHDGLSVRLGQTPPASGWIAGGLGYQRTLFSRQLVVDAAARLSSRRFAGVDARVEAPHLANDRLSVGALAAWQDLTQIGYFGLGADSLRDDGSQYRIRASDVSGYAIWRPARIVSVIGRVGVLQRPTLSAPAGWESRGFPDTLRLFSDAGAPGIGDPSAFVHGEAALAIETFDRAGHPSRGGRYEASVATYRDRDHDRFSFTRYRADATQFVPVVRDLWTLGMRGSIVASRADPGQRVPFYLQESLGGENVLRGFDDFRFHDNDLAALTIESRLALLKHLDLALFADLGKVGADIGVLRRSDMKTSYGIGFRAHMGLSTISRVDVSHGAEGWRCVFEFSDPLLPSIFKRWAAIVP